MEITFIGGGSMGETMLSAILGKGLSTPQAIYVSDIAEARRSYLKQKYGVPVTESNPQAVEKGEVVILAIKPQNAAQVMAELNGRLKPSQLVLSIVAGVRVNSLCLGLNHSRLVRVMPNTPAQVGQGISMWTATSEVNREQREQVRSILAVMGKEIYVDEEKYLDMATAVSGSGPAYVFLFMESLIKAAEEIGLPSEIARELVLQTVIGSGQYARQSAKALSELRRMVTSPGGTTAEALAHLEKGKFTDVLIQAVIAAHEKAKRLGA